HIRAWRPEKLGGAVCLNEEIQQVSQIFAGLLAVNLIAKWRTTSAETAAAGALGKLLKSSHQCHFTNTSARSAATASKKSRNSPTSPSKSAQTAVARLNN